MRWQTCLLLLAKFIPIPWMICPIYPGGQASHLKPGAMFTHCTPGKHGLYWHWKRKVQFLLCANYKANHPANQFNMQIFVRCSIWLTFWIPNSNVRIKKEPHNFCFWNVAALAFTLQPPHLLNNHHVKDKNFRHGYMATHLTIITNYDQIVASITVISCGLSVS